MRIGTASLAGIEDGKAHAGVIPKHHPQICGGDLRCAAGVVSKHQEPAALLVEPTVTHVMQDVIGVTQQLTPQLAESGDSEFLN